jgi:hypothetical protein
MFGLIKKLWEEYDSYSWGCLCNAVTGIFVKNTAGGNVALLIDMFEW